MNYSRNGKRKKMINILKYKKQLENCKNMQEVNNFISRYKEKNETNLDWLTSECKLEKDLSEEYTEIVKAKNARVFTPCN